MAQEYRSPREVALSLLGVMGDTLTDTLLYDNPRQTVLGTGALSFFIGVLLAQPFDVFANSVSYRFMNRLPENLWATIFLFVGVTKITVCLLNAPLMRCQRLRYLPFALNTTTCVMWALVWAGIYLSNPNTLGTVIYFFLVLSPAWAAWRRWRQARGRL